VEGQVQEILRQMQQQSWLPDYIVGITRGGLVPANLMSQYLQIPMHTLRVSLRDSVEGCESNFWMQEDACNHKRILIVDDINDSGATLNWIAKDWAAEVPWNHSVRVAVLYDNESSGSRITPDFSAVTINKADVDEWIDFPWESWWY
jgi:hypoxanthine phosphoribosyltransferase